MTHIAARGWPSSRDAITTHSTISGRTSRRRAGGARISAGCAPGHRGGRNGRTSDLPRIHSAGLFAGPVDDIGDHYRLRVRYDSDEVEVEDPYRFPPILSDLDLHLLGEGTHLELYNKLGAHPSRLRRR